jgi:hypothetical protein
MCAGFGGGAQEAQVAAVEPQAGQTAASGVHARVEVEMNHITPYRDRVLHEDGRIEFGDYRVDGDEIPDLVARGVMPLRFLLMRKDAKTRFKGCESAADVRGVLRDEGFYGQSERQ